MKVIKKSLSIIIWALLGLIIIYNIYNYASIKIFNKDITTINGYASLKVVSGSMEPTINVGDMIIINTKVDEYKKEDIITFKDAKGSYVTHRIIEIIDEGYVTKGDNNDSIDQGYITDKDIIGKYVTRIRFIGVILESFQNPITMILILTMGIIICFLISTDKNGIPKDITEEDKEFIKFLESKKKVEKNITQEKTKQPNKKIDESTKKTNNKSTSKKTTNQEKTKQNNKKTNNKSNSKKVTKRNTKK